MSDTNAAPFTAEEAREESRACAMAAARARSGGDLDDFAARLDRFSATYRLYAEMIEREPSPMVADENDDPKEDADAAI